jgi:hypothetical protein
MCGADASRTPVCEAPPPPGSFKDTGGGTLDQHSWSATPSQPAKTRTGHVERTARPQQGRRGTRRARARFRLFTRQLHAAVSLVVLSGPRAGITPLAWKGLRARAQRETTRIRRLLGCDTSICDSILCKWASRSPDLWAVELLNASRLRQDASSFGVVLERALSPARRLCCGDSEVSCGNPSETVAVSLRSNGYTVGRKEQQERFRKIDLPRLDIATVGDTLLDPLKFVEYPYDLLFTEEYLRLCMVTPEPVRGHQSLNLGPKVTKGDLADALKHMMFFSTDPAVLDAPRNGLFALLKGLDECGLERHRLVADFVRGNAEFSMAKMQGLYEELVAADPERAARLGCGFKVMNIASPADLTDVPPGICSKSSSDYASYFFQFAQLEFLLRYQGLFDVDGASVDMPWAKRVRVGLRVLAMGNWLSALIAHVCHWVILTRGLVRKSIRAVRPESTSSAHVADLRTVCELAMKETDGCVAWKAIPVRMREKCMAVLPNGTGAGSERLDELRVPPVALMCEPVSEVHGLDPTNWVEIHTRLLGGGRTARADVVSFQRQNVRARVPHGFLALATCYQDDQHTFTYGPEENEFGLASCALAEEVAALHRLLTTLVADQAGLRQNAKKMRWPNRTVDPILGIETDFLNGVRQRVRFAMAPERRRRTADELLAIVSYANSGVQYVCEEQLRSLVGELTWCLLARRALLSCLDCVYKALNSPNRPKDLVLLTERLLGELWLSAGLLTFAESTTGEFASTLFAFDAAGKSRWGKGGIGVVSRETLTQEVATELTTPFGPSRLSMFRVQADGDTRPCYRTPPTVWGPRRPSCSP